MAWIEIMPDYRALFATRGWDSAAPYMAWTGVLVNRHRHRQVERVFLPPPSPPDCFYLKKQFRVTWHERFLNAWHGFGWCATAVREAAIQQAARTAGVGCPDVIAFGEDRRRAFVLTRAEAAMTELRAFVQQLTTAKERHGLADALGRTLARLHDAGFDHPDLFAKHILVECTGGAYRFCILDWARARRRRVVSWQLRRRDLAVLDATLYAALASDRVRLRCLRAYWSASTASGALPPFRHAAQAIRRFAKQLRTRRNYRELGQLPTAARGMEFVPVLDGRLLIVGSYFDQMCGQTPAWLKQLTESDAHVDTPVRVQWWPSSSPSWEIPTLAHALFRLRRFGVPVPRLLAIGASTTHVFVATQVENTNRWHDAMAQAPFATKRRLLQQAGRLVRQVHEAGYDLPTGEKWSRRLEVGVESGDVVLTTVEYLRRTDAGWQDLAQQELLPALWNLPRTDHWTLLRSYLGADYEDPASRTWLERLITQYERSLAA